LVPNIAIVAGNIVGLALDFHGSESKERSPTRDWPPRSEHFLLSRAARALSLAGIMRLSDGAAFDTFNRIRWADNGGEPFWPHCGAIKVYTLAETPIRWKCSSCRYKL
jgi:hypothetical protein